MASDSSEDPQWKKDSTQWLEMLESQLYQQAKNAKTLMVFCTDEESARVILQNFLSGVGWMFQYFNKHAKYVLDVST